MMNEMMMMMNEYDVIGINQCLCLPKADLKTKNSTKPPRKGSFGWVFGIQLDSLEKKCISYRRKTYNIFCVSFTVNNSSLQNDVNVRVKTKATADKVRCW